MIFNYDHNYPKVETERTFTYPLELKLETRNKKPIVVFGGRDAISGKIDKFSGIQSMSLYNMLVFSGIQSMSLYNMVVFSVIQSMSLYNMLVFYQLAKLY